MDQAAVVQKAESIAREKEWDLAQYQAPTAELKNATWYVRFEGIKRAPGNHFIVEVNDQTGEATLWPGR